MTPHLLAALKMQTAEIDAILNPNREFPNVSNHRYYITLFSILGTILLCVYASH